MVGYPLPPVQRSPPPHAHLPPDFRIIFYCFSVFACLSSPGYMTPAHPNQPGHGSLFHPSQYDTPGPAGVVQEIEDTVANKRSISTLRYYSRIHRTVSTLPLDTGLQGRISTPPSITGHERGHLSPNITRLKPEHHTRLQYTQRDGGRTRTHSGTAASHYNLCWHMDDGSPKPPHTHTPIPRALRHMARSLRVPTCPPPLPPPLPLLPCRRLLPTATMVWSCEA